MSNSGQFITIQRAKEKNKTEHHNLSTSVSYEEEKKERKKFYYQGNTILYHLLILVYLSLVVGHFSFCLHYSHEL